MLAGDQEDNLFAKHSARLSHPYFFRSVRRHLERSAGPAAAIFVGLIFRSDPGCEPFSDDDLARAVAGEVMTREKFFESRVVFDRLRRAADEGPARPALKPHVS